MKAKILLIILGILFALMVVGTLTSCSNGKDDPQPAYDCHTLAADAQRSHNAWQTLVKNPPSSNTTDQVKADYQKARSAAKQKYIADQTLYNQHCQ